jgi:mRNA-degrading endonuclease RelE of RelBE toxin-antitoxin system
VGKATATLVPGANTVTVKFTSKARKKLKKAKKLKLAFKATAKDVAGNPFSLPKSVSLKK